MAMYLMFSKEITAFVLFLFITALGFGQNNTVAILPSDTPSDIVRKAAQVVPSARQLHWQQLEVTGFFHFGINTFTNREWGDGKEDPKLFNPTNLNAKQWVRTAKEAGIKQVILTAKHHDGFCLWPTKTTSHSVRNSPWKKGKGDVVKEVSEACKEYKVGFGIYLSPWDRNSALYGTEDYNDFFVAQLTELLTDYGRIDEVWFDGANGEGPNGKKQVYDFERWYQVIRNLQPTATIAVMGPDIRWVGTEMGYGREQEWSVVPINNINPAETGARSQQNVAFKPEGNMMGSDLGSRAKVVTAKGLAWYPAETDVSIRPGWFYHAEEDNKVKSPQKLLDIYLKSVGRNGVLLLNIPPDKNGLISSSDVKNLRSWKALRDSLFANNLAKDALIKTTNEKAGSLLFDGKLQTFFPTSERDSTITITMSFSSPKTFDVLLLQENIALGQRIEKFSLQVLNGTQWKKVGEGTTVGYKRLLQFDPITTTAVQLVIESSRLNPNLAEFGLYKFPASGK